MYLLAYDMLVLPEREMTPVATCVLGGSLTVWLFSQQAAVLHGGLGENHESMLEL